MTVFGSFQAVCRTKRGNSAVTVLVNCDKRLSFDYTFLHSCCFVIELHNTTCNKWTPQHRCQLFLSQQPHSVFNFYSSKGLKKQHQICNSYFRITCCYELPPSLPDAARQTHQKLQMKFNQFLISPFQQIGVRLLRLADLWDSVLWSRQCEVARQPAFAPNSANQLSSRIHVYPEDMIQK